MARYVMANRRAGKFKAEEKIASRDAMSNVMAGPFMAGGSIVADNQPQEETARHMLLFEAEPAEMAAKMNILPADVIVEPEILHYWDTYRPADLLGITSETMNSPVVFGTLAKLEVTVTGAGQPLPGAKVILILRFGNQPWAELEEVTNNQGVVHFEYADALTPTALITVPDSGFWPMILRGPTNPVGVDCPKLPTADSSIEWWHRRLGVSSHSKTRGRGIRVGVIDSGVGPHPNLDHVTDIGAFIDSAFDPLGGADANQHGTHVSGIIGARPANDVEFAGLAPGVRLFSARVFPPDGGANQLDIVNAIDNLSRDQEVDLINMSLGSSQGSAIGHDGIIDAFERGTVCICAAGNSNGPVEFPAAFAETVAVAAFGLEGWGPAGSLPANRLPQNPLRFGDRNLYHANFSCFGSNITCGAPGVGILSTVPVRGSSVVPYASMGGTSMASPAACGALAAILSRSAEYKALPRNKIRAAMAVRILREHCRTIGLEPNFEGHGLPLA